MKLAEALQIRADLQTRVAQMPVRLRNNAVVQEGSVPAENPIELMAELDSLLDRLARVTVRINLTNAAAFDDKGRSMTQLLAERDSLRRQIEIYRNFADAAADIAPRRSLTEIRVISTVSVPELRKKCDTISKRLREIELKIQELNWTIELEA